MNPASRADETAGTGLLFLRSSARVERAGQDFDLGGLSAIADPEDDTAPTHLPLEKTIGLLLHLGNRNRLFRHRADSSGYR